MKSTGIIRKVDELGRIVLPIELRRMLEIEEHDPLEIAVEDERIILRKHLPACVFCGAAEDLIEYRADNRRKAPGLPMRPRRCAMGTCSAWSGSLGRW